MSLNPNTVNDQGLHCPLTESLDTTECMNEEQVPGLYFIHTGDDLTVRFVHVRRYFLA